MTAPRAKALAALLAPTTTLVVEDDHAGDIASDPLVSIGAHLPARTVHIRSFSKSHGPDLRLAAVGGAGDVVAAVANRRLLGPGWSSRILQALLVEMLDDEATIEAVAVARVEYARRRGDDRRRAPHLGRRDDRHRRDQPVDGASPTSAARSSRSPRRASASAPGDPFMVHPDDDHLRITVGLVDHDLAGVAAKLADAAGHPARRTGHR